MHKMFRNMWLQSTKQCPMHIKTQRCPSAWSTSPDAPARASAWVDTQVLLYEDSVLTVQTRPDCPHATLQSVTDHWRYILLFFNDTVFTDVCHWSLEVHPPFLQRHRLHWCLSLITGGTSSSSSTTPSSLMSVTDHWRYILLFFNDTFFTDVYHWSLEVHPPLLQRHCLHWCLSLITGGTSSFSSTAPSSLMSVTDHWRYILLFFNDTVFTDVCHWSLEVHPPLLQRHRLHWCLSLIIGGTSSSSSTTLSSLMSVTDHWRYILLFFNDTVFTDVCHWSLEVHPPLLQRHCLHWCLSLITGGTSSSLSTTLSSLMSVTDHWRYILLFFNDTVFTDVCHWSLEVHPPLLQRHCLHWRLSLITGGTSSSSSTTLSSLTSVTDHWRYILLFVNDTIFTDVCHWSLEVHPPLRQRHRLHWCLSLITGGTSSSSSTTPSSLMSGSGSTSSLSSVSALVIASLLSMLQGCKLKQSHICINTVAQISGISWELAQQKVNAPQTMVEQWKILLNTWQ